MKRPKIISGIGIIEILIGGITLIVTLGTAVLSLNTKSLNVLIFVICAAFTSILIGVGILKCNKLAYQLLLYFSSVVVLSKILIFMDILQLNGALETTIPSSLKDGISIIYHSFILYYLPRPHIKKIFGIQPA